MLATLPASNKIGGGRKSRLSIVFPDDKKKTIEYTLSSKHNWVSDHKNNISIIASENRKSHKVNDDGIVIIYKS